MIVTCLIEGLSTIVAKKEYTGKIRSIKNILKKFKKSSKLNAPYRMRLIISFGCVISGAMER